MLLPYTFLLCFSQYSCFSVAGREIPTLPTDPPGPFAVQSWNLCPLSCSSCGQRQAALRAPIGKVPPPALSLSLCPSERPALLQRRETALRVWTRLCQRPSLPGRVCSSLESNAKGSQASDWAVSGLLAASTSKGLSSAVIMNSKSRPFGPRGKIQRFLLRVWFIPLTLLGNSFSVLFQAKFPLSSTGDWADSTTWIFGQ